MTEVLKAALLRVQEFGSRHDIDRVTEMLQYTSISVRNASYRQYALAWQCSKLIRFSNISSPSVNGPQQKTVHYGDRRAECKHHHDGRVTLAIFTSWS